MILQTRAFEIAPSSITSHANFMSPIFYFYCHSHHRDLHSFPTRRSSDLGVFPCLAAWKQSETRCCRRTGVPRSEEHTSELQSRRDLVCRLLLEKKNTAESGASARRTTLRFGVPSELVRTSLT